MALFYRTSLDCWKISPISCPVCKKVSVVHIKCFNNQIMNTYKGKIQTVVSAQIKHETVCTAQTEYVFTTLWYRYIINMDMYRNAHTQCGERTTGPARAAILTEDVTG